MRTTHTDLDILYARKVDSKERKKYVSIPFILFRNKAERPEPRRVSKQSSVLKKNKPTVLDIQ